jgi:very-short-patch-repair endonuclease
VRSYENRPSGTVDRARDLRRNAPEPERRLLRALREAFPYLKWRHQTPIGPFYADILCFSERLVIEVDGDTHAVAVTYDAARTTFMEREGYRVIRVTNDDIMSSLDGVIAVTSSALHRQEETAQSPERENIALMRKGASA